MKIQIELLTHRRRTDSSRKVCATSVFMDGLSANELQRVLQDVLWAKAKWRNASRQFARCSLNEVDGDNWSTISIER